MLIKEESIHLAESVLEDCNCTAPNTSHCWLEFALRHCKRYSATLISRTKVYQTFFPPIFLCFLFSFFNFLVHSFTHSLFNETLNLFIYSCNHSSILSFKCSSIHSLHMLSYLRQVFLTYFRHEMMIRNTCCAFCVSQKVSKWELGVEPCIRTHLAIKPRLSICLSTKHPPPHQPTHQAYPYPPAQPPSLPLSTSPPSSLPLSTRPVHPPSLPHPPILPPNVTLIIVSKSYE